jgi:Ser/Thr protein kinase RdoA (MazF antagonist)
VTARMTSLEAPPQAVLDLIDAAQVHWEPLDPRGRPWLVSTPRWQAVLRSGPMSYANAAWLHRFLALLAQTGMPAPAPLPILAGHSLAKLDGVVWQALTFVPGRPVGWDATVALEAVGALLARFHLASLRVSPTDQRPQADPMEACRPVAEPRIVDRFHRDLQDLGHADVARCVVHGDFTTANMLVDRTSAEVVGMIDFELAHLGPPESDISFSLWVTGRTAQPDRTLDAHRVRPFVAGYHRVRPLGSWAVRAIPVYLVGRGLQMRMRAERRGQPDETQLERLRWLASNRSYLEEAVSSAIHA